MNITTEIIKASCKGVKDNEAPNQDHIQIAENEEYLITSVSDGLGSSKYSSNGAALASRIVINNLKKMKEFCEIEQLKFLIPQEWKESIEVKLGNVKDYRTANSFVVVMKKVKKIVLGRLGDVLIAIRIDGQLRQINPIEKDFLNETDCFGSGNLESYEILVYDFVNNFEFLIVTDGIGDELNFEKMDPLFDYLLTKYKIINKRKRNLILKKEINQNLNDKNNDDKSLVFVWSN